MLDSVLEVCLVSPHWNGIDTSEDRVGIEKIYKTYLMSSYCVNVTGLTKIVKKWSFFIMVSGVLGMMKLHQPR